LFTKVFCFLLFARRHHVQQRGRPADEQRARLAKVRAVAVVGVAVPRRAFFGEERGEKSEGIGAF
jgi:hypothetical protein